MLHKVLNLSLFPELFYFEKLSHLNLCIIFDDAYKIFQNVIYTIGGFPNEIKTKIRYLIICCYHDFML